MSIQPPPSREKLPVNNGWAEMPRTWIKYFNELASQAASTAATTWSAISKAGSNLADLETRNHASLQNLNTADYAHFYLSDRDNLVSGSDTVLHYHDSDRNTDNHVSGTTNKVFTATEQTKLSGIEAGAEVNNISDVNATDLTDGGVTTLHTHSATPVSNLISTPTTIAADTSYIVSSYLTVTSDLTVNGNLMVIG